MLLTFGPCVRTLLDERAKCRDSIQKLMRIIIAQGTTISTQLAGLKEKEEAIDNFEERMHNLRMRESGRDYLLHTYLDQLPEVSVYTRGLRTDHVHYQAQSKDPLCVTPRTSRRGSGVTREARARGSPSSHPCGGVKPGELGQWTEALDRLARINGDLTTQVSEQGDNVRSGL